ncbi:MAG: hypothetical protein LAP39_13760 [Acidobacteriia bacterium]|nr:hypothetical protein [Terriglobia bacterium]
MSLDNGVTLTKGRVPALLLAVTVVSCAAQTVVLDGTTAQAAVDLAGGSLIRFQFKEQRLNPLTWTSGEPAPAYPAGHFLCLDRWGPPSEAESRNGMPFHGEASHVVWKLLRGPAHTQGEILAELAAALPIAGFEVTRRMRLSDNAALLRVSESVTNTGKLGRVYNMVQHPSIAPPFLDETTVVDANAGKGFMQSSPLPNPEERAVWWPQALKDGQPVDLRRLTNDAAPEVVSFTIDGEYAWVTASTAAKGLLIGYIWKTSDYPWLDIWRNVANGTPAARGLEFGTTGLHQPVAILVSKGKIFGRAIYAYIDAGQTVTRAYAAFLFKIPEDYRGVERITYDSGHLILHERGSGPDRDLRMEAGGLFNESAPRN